MREIIVGSRHPFVRDFSVAVVSRQKGVWECRWRDFTTMRQEREFKSSDEAYRYAEWLRKKHRTTPLRFTEDDLGGDIDQIAEFWEELAPSYVEVPF